MSDILARIDEATTARCRCCDTPLSPSGPSQDFCGPDCQHDWADLFVTDPHDVYDRKDPTLADLGEDPASTYRAGWYRLAIVSVPVSPGASGSGWAGARPVATWVDETTSFYERIRAAEVAARASLVFEFEVIPAPDPPVQVDAPRFTAGEAGWYRLDLTPRGRRAT